MIKIFSISYSFSSSILIIKDKFLDYIWVYIQLKKT